MNRVASALLPLLLVTVLAACGGRGGGSSTPVGSGATGSAARSEPAITDISDISQLRDAFNRQAGKPRLIVLMSPT